MNFSRNLIMSKNIVIIFTAILLTIVGCSGHSGEDNSKNAVTPDLIINESRVDLLSDVPYYFPLITNKNLPKKFQILRKWDFIFVGGFVDAYQDRGITSRLIPGEYDHVLVYLGKDLNGNAYAAELNVDSLKIEFSTMKVAGGIRLYCLGTDYGENIHSSGSIIFDETYYSLRWARTFKNQFKENLHLKNIQLTTKVMEDLKVKFPYQLEFNNSLANLALTKKLILIDDGLLNGAGCADYWTTLFEEYSNICIKGSRLKASEMTDYFLNDTEGQIATIPAYLNPFGTGDLLAKDLLISHGITIVDDQPHIFSCDKSIEQGLVTPTRLFSAEQLEDPETISK